MLWSNPLCSQLNKSKQIQTQSYGPLDLVNGKYSLLESVDYNNNIHKLLDWR